MYRMSVRAAYVGFFASIAIVTVLGASAQADSFTATDQYWGGLNQYNPSNGDVISAPSDHSFDISSVEVSRTNSGNTLVVSIHTNYAGVPGTGPADGTNYGSLFFSTNPGWSPVASPGANNGPPTYGSDVYAQNEWTHAFQLNGTSTGLGNTPTSGTGVLYSTGTILAGPAGSNLVGGVVKNYNTNTGKIYMSNVNGNPVSAPGAGNPGFFFRQGQAVNFVNSTGAALSDAGSGWAQDVLNPLDKILTFTIIDNGLLTNDFALAWAMTCANDVMQVAVHIPSEAPPPNVPLPGAVWLMGTMLFGAGGFAKWRKRRARGAA